ncbi:hypothetical protein IAQ61_001113 [Plenodomus lingam]|uniref:uncharacterized protein n=1 Tax=Leptosphaeria maculans TaxID=5022 RepID=UPI00332E30AD|nr:hypothetical protein IAQ61_001113 [Plenodomus lingam]
MVQSKRSGGGLGWEKQCSATSSFRLSVSSLHINVIPRRCCEYFVKSCILAEQWLVSGHEAAMTSDQRGAWMDENNGAPRAEYST